MEEHHAHPGMDDHLRAALREAEATLADLEAQRASTASAAWYGSIRTLRRFLAHEHCPTSPAHRHHAASTVAS